jgi:hypothetical protein
VHRRLHCRKYFRKRDPRFASVDRHDPDKVRPPRFNQCDFAIYLDKLSCHCPAGHVPHLKNANFVIDGRQAIPFMARKSDCGPCQ